MTPLLNHGYLAVIEHWGSDERIIEAARMSTAKGFIGWEAESRWRCPSCGYVMQVDHNDRTQKVQATCCSSAARSLTPHDPFNTSIVRTELSTLEYIGGHNGDEKLLRYLYTHAHHTPFEMAGMIIEVQAPILVFREWQRHRTQSYNELSARYTELPDMFYLPSEERMLTAGQSSTNKQAGDSAMDEATAEWARNEMALSYQRCRVIYEQLLKAGVAREIARAVIPVAQYSRMRSSANLRNWLAFCTLRMDPRAQWEIRQYANAVGAALAQRFPRTWELFMEGKAA